MTSEVSLIPRLSLVILIICLLSIPFICAENEEAESVPVNIWGSLGILAIVLLILVPIQFILFVIAMADIIKKPVKNKAMWILLLAFTGLIGIALYFSIGRHQLDQKISIHAAPNHPIKKKADKKQSITRPGF